MISVSFFFGGQNNLMILHIIWWKHPQSCVSSEYKNNAYNIIKQLSRRESLKIVKKNKRRIGGLWARLNGSRVIIVVAISSSKKKKKLYTTIMSQFDDSLIGLLRHSLCIWYALCSHRPPYYCLSIWPQQLQ